MTNARKGTALITGASSGIGAAYADRLARRGYDIILVARNRPRLHELAARLESDTDALVGVLAADLTDEADLRRVERAFGLDSSINLLVNSAGMGLAAPTLESNIDTMQQMISLNVTALTRLNYAAATEFVDRGHGTIINIASGVALVPEILNGVYGASKAFVLGLSQALRQELEGSGVRVQVVMPGAVATEFWDHAGRPVEQLPGEIVMSVDDVVDAALAGLDLGEFATLPALPSIEEWNAFDAARVAFRPKISAAKPARRYGGGQPPAD